MSGGSLSVIGGKAYWNGKALEYYNSNSSFFEHRDWVGSRRATHHLGCPRDQRAHVATFGDETANVSGGQDKSVA
jgi:hypothetical protein